MSDIEEMTLWEYNLRMKAHNLKTVDEEERIHSFAWANREVNAKRKSGKNKMKYIYTSWKDFFDYDERVSKVLGREIKNDKPLTIAQKWEEYERQKSNGQL